MPKLTAVSTEPPSRVELAERHLADLRNRAAEIDRHGAGLLSELQALPDRIATASLDAIENEAKRPGLTALRQRSVELPTLIEAVKAERAGLDGEISVAEAAVHQAEVEAAAQEIMAKLDERPRLAAEIDATLASLAAQYRTYCGVGADLTRALRTLGMQIDVGRWDDTRLKQAVRAAGKDLALATGQRPPQRLVTGDMKYVDDLSRWDDEPGMASNADVELERLHDRLAELMPRKEAA